MTKTDIIQSFNKFGITLPSSGKSDFMRLEQNIHHIIFSDSNKWKRTDKYNEYQFDMTNEVIVQRRVRKDGKVICYPKTDVPCLNVFSFDSLLNISSIEKGAL